MFTIDRGFKKFNLKNSSGVANYVMIFWHAIYLLKISGYLMRDESRIFL